MTVPTAAERGGDFSGLVDPTTGAAITLYDPKTGNPIPGNNLANATVPISPQALALLNYYPVANIPTTAQGYNFVTTGTSASHTENGSLRYTRNLGANAGGGRGRGGFGGPGGGRGQQNQNAPKVIDAEHQLQRKLMQHAASDQPEHLLGAGRQEQHHGV